MRKLIGCCLAAILLSSCGFYHEKNPEDPATVSAQTVSWPLVSRNFFQRRCAICHSVGGAGVNVSDYQDVVSKINRIQQEVLSQKMPPDSPATPYEQKLLTTWISAGMPYSQ